jgi:hypothetical protein
MSQVLIKFFNKQLESLTLDLVLTEHRLEIEMIKSEKICEQREAVARILEKIMIINKINE